MPQHIVITEYNPSWPKMFEQEAAAIKQILGENCVAIYHIGSTAVPGLAAKPIIDIMPVVKKLTDVDQVSNQFESIGYEYMGEFGIAGRRYLRKGGDERTHQIHIFAKSDDVNINRHLAFRDYLRTHENIKNAYGELKIKLAQKYPYNIDGYCDGKERFVKEIESKALSYWAEKQAKNRDER